MSKQDRQRSLVAALGTARPPAVAFIAVTSFVLAAVIGTVAGLEDSTSGLAAWTRLWRWYVADFTTAAVVTLGVLVARRLAPGRWYAGGSNVRALALSYGSYLIAGCVGGGIRFLIAQAVGVPPFDASVPHHLARAAVIAVGMVLLGVLANQYVGFLDRIHAQEQALHDRIAQLAKENRERRLAEEAAIVKERRLAATLRTMAEGVILTNRDGRVLLLNQAAERLVGRSQHEAVARGLGEVLPSSLAPLAADVLRQQAHGQPREVRTDGEPRVYLQVLWTSIADGPEAGGRVLLLRDVTEERTARQASEQEQRLAALGQLVAGIAHDFNNLLTGVIGATDALKMRDDLPESARGLVERVGEGGLRAAHLVRQLLDFSRGSPTPLAPLDVAAIVLRMQEILKHTVPESVLLSIEIAPGALTVQGNESQLERLLMNLAVNAGQAMPEGGELRIRVSRLAVDAQTPPPLPSLSPGRWVVITVSDTGLGIPPENLDKVFDPFFTTKGLQGGTGLGLAQVHGIARQHDGYVVVNSRLGLGTIFTVYLPAIAEPVVSPIYGLVPDVPLGRGETILLVEDDPLVRDVVQVLLERLGYRTLSAGNGQEALEVYRLRGNEVHVVLTDVTMPVIGGVELARTLRQWDPNVKLIVFTGYAIDSEMRRYAGAGIVEWLEKPPQLPALAQALRRALDPPKGPAGPGPRTGERRPEAAPGSQPL